jgi:hypothetical protein
LQTKKPPYGKTGKNLKPGKPWCISLIASGGASALASSENSLAHVGSRGRSPHQIEPLLDENPIFNFQFQFSAFSAF